MKNEDSQMNELRELIASQFALQEILKEAI